MSLLTDLSMKFIDEDYNMIWLDR